MKKVEKTFTCECGLPEHQFSFSYYPEDLEEDPFMYLQVHMVPEPRLLHRIWYAIKYVFGFRTKYGEYDEVLIGEEEAVNLLGLTAEFLHGLDSINSKPL